ncbi:hypothetical protein [Methanobrevibacter sp.]|uniref:hypothetical protein n=1 Tax=Methanobrevibacter sp. TaxID=66852 RepID=UPI003890C2EA
MITVEDINSCMSRYGINGSYHRIDTSNIGTVAYLDVKYDFVICSHTISGSNHTFTFKPQNTAWTGGYYILDSEGDYIDANATWDSSTGVLSYTTTEESITLVLYCSNLASSFNIVRLTNKLVNPNCIFVNHDEIGEDKTIRYVNLTTGAESDTTITLARGVNTILSNHYLMVYVRKIDYEVSLDANLIVGKVNTVSFNAPTGFDATCTVSYLGKTDNFSLSDGSFEIDLTNFNSNKNLEVFFTILENEDVLSKTFRFILPVNYVNVGTYVDLVNQINSGASILQLTDDILFYNHIYVNHDVLIKGAEHNLDLDEYSFFVTGDCNLKLENINISNGNPVIFQRKNSKVNLTKCSFTGASNDSYNNLGSVISCDIDISSLNVPNDFITNISDCKFINNHNCILHGGTLTVRTSSFHNTDMGFIDINNPAFLYQVDGEAIVADSIFDIDYTGRDYEAANLMYAQALFMIGENALINNANHKDLSKDNNVNWCNAPYNNLSHVFCKYYYSQIEEAVFSSPEAGYEDKSLCYCVSGSDWIFKEHVQITRESSGIENRNRKIIWEDE